jgi:hypothetical protein
MLSLHLLQSALVHLNTIFLQRVLDGGDLTLAGKDRRRAISLATDCTAAIRRPTSSSVANAKVACPNTNTAPPSAPSTRLS